MLTLSMNPAHGPNHLGRHHAHHEEVAPIRSRSALGRQYRVRRERTPSPPSLVTSRSRNDPSPGRREGIPLTVPPRNESLSRSSPALAQRHSAEHRRVVPPNAPALLPASTYQRPKPRLGRPSVDLDSTVTEQPVPRRPSRNANSNLLRPKEHERSEPRSAPTGVKRFADHNAPIRVPSTSPSPRSISSTQVPHERLSRKQTFDDETDVSLFAEALSGIAAGPMTEPLHQGAFPAYSSPHVGRSSNHPSRAPRAHSPSLDFTHYQSQYPYEPQATRRPAASSSSNANRAPSVYIISPLTPDSPPTFRSPLQSHSRSQPNLNTPSRLPGRSISYNNQVSPDRGSPQLFAYPPTPTSSAYNAPPQTRSHTLNEAMLGLSAHAFPMSPHEPFHPNSSNYNPSVDGFDPDPERIYDNDGLDFDDDELPDYEQSQREAAERTRKLASSRAAELESRWAASSYSSR